MNFRPNHRRFVALVCVLCTGFVMSACGRRGALEAPVSDRVVTTDKAGNPIEKTSPKPDRPFILDGLI